MRSGGGGSYLVTPNSKGYEMIACTACEGSHEMEVTLLSNLIGTPPLEEDLSVAGT